MGHTKPVRLETASTGGESVYLFLEFTIINYENVHRSYALDFFIISDVITNAGGKP